MSNKEFTVEKSIAEVYNVRLGYEWANINIRHKDPRGFGEIMINSSYGSWNKSWGAAGDNFKRFLTSLDMHYFAGKVGASDWFDLDKTISWNLKLIIDSRRSEKISSKDARHFYDEIKQLNYCNERYQFIDRVFDISGYCIFYDGSPEVVKGVDPSFSNFWENLWKPFVQVLKEEIEVKEVVS